MRALVLFLFGGLLIFSIKCQQCHVLNATSINEKTYWGVSEAVAKNHLLQMRSDNDACEGEDCVLLKFMYVKEVFSAFPSKIRKGLVENTIYPEQCETDQFKKQFSDAKERLRSIVAPEGDVTSNKVPEKVQTFDEAIHTLQNWKELGSDDIHVFHLHDENVQGRDVLVQRVQKSGLCYLHAPVVLSHYLVSKYNSTDPTAMINIALHVAGSFDSRALYEHIYSDRGGSSIALLNTFLAPASVYQSWNIMDIEVRTFKLYGPALISGFEVFDDFLAEDRLHYEGLPSGKSLGFHAMVLIGMKTKPVRTFLIQNWWPRKQFISITEEYLIATKPTIYFVTTPQTSIPACFSTYSFRYAESVLLDRPERLLEEKLGFAQHPTRSTARWCFVPGGPRGQPRPADD